MHFHTSITTVNCVGNVFNYQLWCVYCIYNIISKIFYLTRYIVKVIKQTYIDQRSKFLELEWKMKIINVWKVSN